MSSIKPKVSSGQGKWDIRVSSPRKLFRALHDFLDEQGYEHAYEPLRSECDAISDIAIFKTELIGRKDSRERNRFKWRLGIILIFTIILIPLAIHLLRSSKYSLRTIARISVEGESYRARLSAQGTTQREELEVVSDARVTLYVKTGVVERDYGMMKPIKRKSELNWFDEEHQLFERSVAELLRKIELPVWKARRNTGTLVGSNKS